MGRLLIVLGLGLAAIGLFITLGEKIPFLGKLPGDILIKRGDTTFYFPLATCLVVSLLLSLLMRFWGRK